jgi:ribosome-associated protein
MKTVYISQQPVELYKILKFEGLAQSGGEAKTMISEGMVQVNGEIETRKRKKMMSGDTIQCGSEIFSLQLSPEV